MVVTNYEPMTVVSADQDLSWSAEPIDGTDKTMVTVTLKPTDLNFMQGASQIENWDTIPESEGRATFGADTAILLLAENGESTDFYGRDADVVDGLSISKSKDVWAVGAAVHDPHQDMLGAISITVPESVNSKRKSMGEYSDAVMDTAGALNLRLRHEKE